MLNSILWFSYHKVRMLQKGFSQLFFAWSVKWWVSPKLWNNHSRDWINNFPILWCHVLFVKIEAKSLSARAGLAFPVSFSGAWYPVLFASQIITSSSTTVHSSIVLWAFKQTVRDGHGLLLVNHLWNEYMDNMYVHSWSSFIWILKHPKGTGWSTFLVGMINIFHLRAHFKKYHLFLLNTTSLLFKDYNFSPFG